MLSIGRNSHCAAAARCKLGPLVLLLLVIGPAIAQTTTQPAVETNADLSGRQQAIRDRVQRLESRMLQLAQILAETEPEQAERLRDALNKSGQQRIKTRVEQLVALLRTQRFSDADKEQQALLGDLDAILTLLISPTGEMDKRRQEREKLEAQRRAVRALMDEQEHERFRTQEAQIARQQLEAITKLVENLDQLAKRQAELRAAQAERRIGESHTPAQEQQRLERETRDAAKEMAKLAEQNTPESQALPDAAHEVDSAADAMRDAREKMEAGPDASRKDPAGKRDAGDAQQQAEEKLRRAIQRLRSEQERFEEAAKLRPIEREQRETQQKAADVQKSMQPQAEGEPSAPGADEIGRARQNMQKAADRLGEQQPQQAEGEQKEALEQMQQAMDELDDALRQVRREEVEQTLQALEARFRSMLTREEEIRETLLALHKKGPTNWARADQLQLAEASKSQGKLLEDCNVVLRIVTDEGTTVILPELVRQLAADMGEIQTRLDQGDVTAPTQAALDSVIDLLKEIVGAIEAKREQQEQADEQGGEQQGGNDNNPLLPGSAELKLLKSSQIGINKQTKALAPADTDDAVAAPDAKNAALFERLAGRQRQLADLVRKMNERRP